MRDVQVTLLSYKSEVDEIGQEIDGETIENVVPIISQTSITHEEFYEANEQGFKPTLKVTISEQSYSGEKDLIYMNEKYSIIRTTNTNFDELSLICERKVGDVSENN